MVHAIDVGASVFVELADWDEKVRVQGRCRCRTIGRLKGPIIDFTGERGFIEFLFGHHDEGLHLGVSAGVVRGRPSPGVLGGNMYNDSAVECDDNGIPFAVLKEPTKQDTHPSSP